MSNLRTRCAREGMRYIRRKRVPGAAGHSLAGKRVYLCLAYVIDLAYVIE